MFAMLQFALFSFTFLCALLAALSLHWLLLELTLRILQPAVGRGSSAEAGLARGTVRLARVYASHR